MKSKYFIAVALFFAIISPFLLTTAVLAANQPYVTLTNIPGIGTSYTANESNFSAFLNTVFSIGISLAIGLAIIMLVIAGIQYMTSDAFDSKGEAKNKIWNAVGGLILALGIYIFLNTINPDLVNLRLTMARLPAAQQFSGDTSRPAGTSPSMAQSVFSDDARARGLLTSSPNPVQINNPACTSTTQMSGCTNVGGLPQQTIDGLKALAADCGCEIVVTGGTEYWQHSTHGPGQRTVDLRSTASLNTFLSARTPAAANPVSGTTARWGSANLKFENVGDNANATGAHWHVTNI